MLSSPGGASIAPSWRSRTRTRGSSGPSSHGKKTIGERHSPPWRSNDRTMAELVGPTHGEPGYYRGLRGLPSVEARACGFPIGALNPVHDAGYRYAIRLDQSSRSLLQAGG